MVPLHHVNVLLHRQIEDDLKEIKWKLKPLNRSFASQSENPTPNIKDYTKARKQPQKPLISQKSHNYTNLTYINHTFIQKQRIVAPM